VISEYITIQSKRHKLVDKKVKAGKNTISKRCGKLTRVHSRTILKIVRDREESDTLSHQNKRKRDANAGPKQKAK